LCGIAGIYAYRDIASSPDRTELFRVCEHMHKRGPDGSGAWFSEDGRIGLGHRRLSIIDLSDNAAQPMLCAEGRYVVTFNGEIYNYRELRERLERQGRRFRSASDTEVLLHLYRHKGADMVSDLRGMFAFAIWDTKQRTLFLARDPYGIKPLYFADDGSTFRFASQVKALLAGGGCARDPDLAGVAGFYLLGSVPEPYTTFASIRALPAGTTMLVDELGRGEIRKFFSISEIYRSAEGAKVSPTEAQEAIRTELLESVRYHLVSDVPVGIFLSGGIDSGALVGLVRDTGQNVQTVTLRFEEFRGTDSDESTFAAETAKAYGMQHSTCLVTRKEFMEDFPKILAAMDQPSIDGFNSWFVSKAARMLGLKVALSGLGGDELFGGYVNFAQIPRLADALRWPLRIPFLPAAARSLLTSFDLGHLGISPKWASLLEYGGTYESAYFLRRAVFLPRDLPGLLGSDIAAEGLRRLAPIEHISTVMEPGLRSNFAKVATLESAIYLRNQLLRDADWASMAHGLEVRVPFVDSVLLKRSAGHLLNANGKRKRLLASAPSRPLPQSVLIRPKQGFDTPLPRWLADVERTRAASGNHRQQSWGAVSRRLAQIVACSELKQSMYQRRASNQLTRICSLWQGART
jgi:asparagine synthase (glutamine-hydrolysing)